MKIKLMVLALVLVVSSLKAGLALAADESSSLLLPGNPLEGSRLFSEKGCLGCHSVYGVGGVAGPELGQGILKRPLLDIAGVMWNHSPGMVHLFQEQGRTALPQFQPAEMASLLSFLYYLGSLDPPGDATTGGRLSAKNNARPATRWVPEVVKWAQSSIAMAGTLRRST
jgi:mono/diheme cytochrome c family protein